MYKGDEYKRLYWKAVYATYKAEFRMYIGEFKEVDEKAHDDFIK